MIIKIFLFWVLGLAVITYVGTKALPLLPNSGLGAIAPGKDFNYFLSIAQWDGGNYLHIAKEGFSDKKYFAFAPVYPILLKIVSPLPQYQLIVGLLLSTTSFLIFLRTLHKYLSQKYSKEVALNTIISYMVFPTAYFCLITYSESLFLLLILYAIIFLEKKKILLSAITAGISALTRYIGVFFIFSQIFFIMKNKKFNTKDTSLLITLLPITIYMLFLFFKYQNPFLFLDVQNQWGRYGQDPVTTIFTYIWRFATTMKISPNDLLDLTTTLLFIGLLVKGVNKIPGYLWVFSILVVLIPASTGTLIGMPRYVLPSIGAFVILGKILQNSKFKYLIWSISLAVQCFLAGLFITGHWIA